MSDNWDSLKDGFTWLRCIYQTKACQLFNVARHVLKALLYVLPYFAWRVNDGFISLRVRSWSFLMTRWIEITCCITDRYIFIMNQPAINCEIGCKYLHVTKRKAKLIIYSYSVGCLRSSNRRDDALVHYSVCSGTQKIKHCQEMFGRCYVHEKKRIQLRDTQVTLWGKWEPRAKTATKNTYWQKNTSPPNGVLGSDSLTWTVENKASSLRQQISLRGFTFSF